MCTSNKSKNVRVNQKSGSHKWDEAGIPIAHKRGTQVGYRFVRKHRRKEEENTWDPLKGSPVLNKPQMARENKVMVLFGKMVPFGKGRKHSGDQTRCGSAAFIHGLQALSTNANRFRLSLLSPHYR